MVKNTPAYAGDVGSIPGLGSSCREEYGTHSRILGLGNPPGRGAHRQRSLVSYSPCGCRAEHSLVTRQQQQDYSSSLETSAQREGKEKRPTREKESALAPWPCFPAVC